MHPIWRKGRGRKGAWAELVSSGNREPEFWLARHPLYSTTFSSEASFAPKLERAQVLSSAAHGHSDTNKETLTFKA